MVMIERGGVGGFRDLRRVGVADRDSIPVLIERGGVSGSDLHAEGVSSIEFD
jgi:hypothetical protein